MKLSDIISGARVILNDEDASEYQHATADLIRYANDYLLRITKLAPELMVETRQIVLVAGELQSIDRLTTNGLSRILKRQDGLRPRLVALDALDLQFNTWPASDAAPVKEWAPIGDDPWSFMVYPPSPAGQTLQVRVFAVPGQIGLDDVCPIADSFRAAGEHFVAGRALVKNTNPQAVAKGQALLQMAATLSGVQA